MVLGGTGERRMLRVVARHADEWNFSPLRDFGPEAPAEFARLSMVLDGHCDEIGRDPSRIRRSVQMFLRPDDPAQMKESLRLLDGFEDAGAQHVVLGFFSPPAREQMASLAPR
jgi:alkanesulfonate monooxygenase SsuD/methylene tetrahydromethanopterin reductase-like flavin-dependent oxidoreductase (luciferase family)